MGQVGVSKTQDKKENISFLISIFEDSLAFAQAKNSGTKSFHMIPFFESFIEHFTKDLNISLDGVVILLDNFRGAKCKEFYSMVKEMKLKIAFQPGYTPEMNPTESNFL